MTPSIDLKPEYFEIINDIIRRCLLSDPKIWIFGSRTQGTAKPFSDIDLLIDVGRPISIHELSALNNSFDESLLPYKVDIADAWTITGEFRAKIRDQLVSLQENTKTK